MIDIPDAPWIRSMELYGVPDGEDLYNVYCPICGAENPDRFYTQGGDVIGCDECVNAEDPCDWVEKYGVKQ